MSIDFRPVLDFDDEDPAAAWGRAERTSSRGWREINGGDGKARHEPPREPSELSQLCTIALEESDRPLRRSEIARAIGESIERVGAHLTNWTETEPRLFETDDGFFGLLGVHDDAELYEGEESREETLADSKVASARPEKLTHK